MLQSQTHWAGGFEQQRSRPPPAAETGRRGWGSAPLFQSPAKGLQKKRQAQLVRPAVQSGGQKSPCGAFLDARLAISTRAHQKDQRRKYAGLLFYLPEPDGPMITSFSPSATSRLTSFKTCRSPKYFSTCSSLITLHSPFPVPSLPQGALPCRVTKKDALRSPAKRLCL